MTWKSNASHSSAFLLCFKHQRTQKKYFFVFFPKFTGCCQTHKNIELGELCHRKESIWKKCNHLNNGQLPKHISAFLLHQLERNIAIIFPAENII